MPKITQISIQAKNKERCNIFIDGEFSIALDIETVMGNRLKVGLEITENELAKLVHAGAKKEALSKGISYVSKTLKTKKQVKTYLLDKGYTEEIVFFVLDKLQEYNYINDVEYAKRYLEGCSKTQGRRLSEYKLMMKGVKKEDIQAAFDAAQVSTDSNVYELALKYMRNKEFTKENFAKTYRYLVGRGFSFEEVDRAISKIKEDVD